SAGSTASRRWPTGTSCTPASLAVRSSWPRRRRNDLLLPSPLGGEGSMTTDGKKLMASLVGYALLFVLVGVGFIFVHLVAGWLVRPSKMDAEKATIYECGEPTIGSAWVQFDLRFYVVALLFVIF